MKMRPRQRRRRCRHRRRPRRPACCWQRGWTLRHREWKHDTKNLPVAILTDLMIHHLGEKNELYFHDQLSPNDENISFGQLVYLKIEN